MSTTIPDNFMDFIENPIAITLVTVMPDGQPQASPVWFSYDGDHFWLNTARGRQKDKNMTNNPKVTLMFLDTQNPYRYMEVRGLVQEINEEQGLDHINQLSERYTGKPDFYTDRPQRRGKEQRVIYKIKPIRIVAQG